MIFDKTFGNCTPHDWGNPLCWGNEKKFLTLHPGKPTPEESVHVSLDKEVPISSDTITRDNVTWVSGHLIIKSGAHLINNADLYVSGSLTIEAGASLTNSDKGAIHTAYSSINGTITVNGTLTNNGLIRVTGSFSMNGTFNNNGKLYNFSRGKDTPGTHTTAEYGLENAGTLNNKGLLQNQQGGTFRNTAILLNHGIVTNNDTMVNDGEITNFNKIYDKKLSTNNGTINNEADAEYRIFSPNTDGALVINSKDAKLNNNGLLSIYKFCHLRNEEGHITNKGVIDLKRFAILTNHAGRLNNETEGTIKCNWFINNEHNSTFDNYGSLTNTGVFTNDTDSGLMNFSKFSTGKIGHIHNRASAYIVNKPRDGIFENAGEFENAGMFTNESILTNKTDGTLSNEGELVNQMNNFINQGMLTNTGTFTNKGLFKNTGTFTNADEGSFTNVGTMEGKP